LRGDRGARDPHAPGAARPSPRAIAAASCDLPGTGEGEPDGMLLDPRSLRLVDRFPRSRAGLLCVPLSERRFAAPPAPGPGQPARRELSLQKEAAPGRAPLRPLGGGEVG